MNNEMHPLLTIGMIFKNDIRCLERCLKALEPLRRALSCELVMADTGSVDGSREIAERYADVIFDFPWKDDFSAARNAVMSRASGKWYLTVDTDEYLDEDISELTAFLKSAGKQQKKVCSLIQRNYASQEMNGLYADFPVIRLLLMSTGLRYEGIIHERWPITPQQLPKVHLLSRTIFHHDGYAESDSEQIKAKRKRNLKLLKEALDKEPENMTALLQYVESSRQEKNHPEIVRRALAAIENKWTGWQILGAPILRHAVRAARERNMPELQEWIEQAETQFPSSFFTRIDVEYIAFSYDWDEKHYVSCIQRGEKCLSALSDYRNGKGNHNELMYSSLLMSAPYWEQGLKIFLADAYLRTGNSGKCAEILATHNWALFDATQTENFMRVLRELHSMSTQDTAPILLQFWAGIGQPLPDKESAQKRLDAFHRAAALAFTAQNQKTEKEQKGFCRLSYTLFQPLADSCEAGRGAAVLESKDIREIHDILTGVENWKAFPCEALSYALSLGVPFPLENQTLKLEEMDLLIGSMAADKEAFYTLLWRTAKETSQGSLQKLAWLRGLALAAIQIYEWNSKEISDTDAGMSLARLFAWTEREFISNYYRPELLCKENIWALPPLHRLGWYCAQAFQALDGGDPAQYVKNLRSGLNNCQEGKAMIEHLLKHTPQLQKKEVPAELSALAEQIRALLSTFPADSPEVKALKASPAYQKVAELIENK